MAGWRWLFACVPLALAGATAAAWAVPDIGFFEAWPALNVLFFLLGLAAIPAFSPAASLRRKLIHLAVFGPLAAVFIAVLIGAALDRFYGNDLQQTFYLRFRIMLVAGLSAGLLYAAVAGAIVYLRAQHVSVANQRLNAEKSALTAEAVALEAQARTAAASQREGELSRQLTETRLRVLQAQIEPHFLFNTLGAAQQLARKGAPDAAKLIGELVRFLRISLPSLRDERALLRTEFEQIAAYLAIMQVRMGERLTYNVEIPSDERLASFALPPAMVMTLVENAIKHGVEPAADGGHIGVVAAWSESGTQLIVRVTDTGAGLLGTNSQEVGGGVGLSNITQRLQANFGDAAHLLLTPHTPRGCAATLTLPALETAARAPSHPSINPPTVAPP